MPNTADADPGQGYLKIRKNEADPKICISRSTIHPKWSKIKKKHYGKTLKIEKKNHNPNIGEFFTTK